jgi:hypothetical protein
MYSLNVNARLLLYRLHQVTLSDSFDRPPFSLSSGIPLVSIFRWHHRPLDLEPPEVGLPRRPTRREVLVTRLAAIALIAAACALIAAPVSTAVARTRELLITRVTTPARMAFACSRLVARAVRLAAVGTDESTLARVAGEAVVAHARAVGHHTRALAVTPRSAIATNLATVARPAVRTLALARLAIAVAVPLWARALIGTEGGPVDAVETAIRAAPPRGTRTHAKPALARARTAVGTLKLGRAVGTGEAFRAEASAVEAESPGGAVGGAAGAHRTLLTLPPRRARAPAAHAAPAVSARPRAALLLFARITAPAGVAEALAALAEAAAGAVVEALLRPLAPLARTPSITETAARVACAAPRTVERTLGFGLARVATPPRLALTASVGDADAVCCAAIRAHRRTPAPRAMPTRLAHTHRGAGDGRALAVVAAPRFTHEHLLAAVVPGPAGLAGAAVGGAALAVPAARRLARARHLLSATNAAPARVAIATAQVTHAVTAAVGRCALLGGGAAGAFPAGVAVAAP